jgi:hypothetical protein
MDDSDSSLAMNPVPGPGSAGLRAGNLAVKFALELVAIGSFAYWGATVASGALAILLALVAPVLAIALWGRFAAPRSERKLPLRPRIAFELAVFALAALALLRASWPAAIALATVVVANTLLLTALHQWDA